MTDSYWYHLMKAMVALLTVLGLFGISFFLFRLFTRRGLKTGLHSMGTSPVRIIARSYLGPKKNIAIVDVAGEVLVLGLTPNSIVCLTKLERPEAIDEVRRYQARGGRPFLEVLHQKLNFSRSNSGAGTDDA